MIAIARYHRNPATNWAELAVVVREEYRRRGLAEFLLRELGKIALEQGIVGFTADVLAENTGMLALLRGLADPVEVTTHSAVAKVRFLLRDLKPRDLT
jgi:GNAT superfamily N-acetyltransferase